MRTISKYTQLNYIGDIFEPRYSTNDVLISTGKVTRSKLDIKLKFEKVNDTSEYAGYWFVPRKTVTKYRKKFDNNGRQCYIIPWHEFEKLELISREDIY